MLTVTYTTIIKKKREDPRNTRMGCVVNADSVFRWFYARLMTGPQYTPRLPGPTWPPRLPPSRAGCAAPFSMSFTMYLLTVPQLRTDGRLRIRVQLNKSPPPNHTELRPPYEGRYPPPPWPNRRVVAQPSKPPAPEPPDLNFEL